MVNAAGRPAPFLQRKCQLHPPVPPTTGAPSSFPPPPSPSPCSFLLPPWGHLSRAPFLCAPQGIVTLSALSNNRPRRSFQVCRAVSCPSPPHNRCTVGFCSVHCTSRKCRRCTLHPGLQPKCRHSGCTKPDPPGCPVRFCNLHAPAFVVRSTTLFPCQETVRGGLPTDNNTLNPFFVVHSPFVWGSSIVVTLG